MTDLGLNQSERTDRAAVNDSAHSVRFDPSKEEIRYLHDINDGWVRPITCSQPSITHYEIYYTFYWHSTPQGFDYWSQIATAGRNEPVPPELLEEIRYTATLLLLMAK